MLKRLQEWGYQQKIFSVEKICSLSKTCCSAATTAVVDFDKVKDWYCKKRKEASRSSVDAIVFHPSQNILYFIEMKGWQKFVKNQDPIDKAKIDAQAQQFKCPQKLQDSIFILYNIVKDEIQGTKEQQDFFVSVAKRFILLTDIDSLYQQDPLNFIVANLGLLSELSSKIDIEAATRDALNLVSVKEFSNFNLISAEYKKCNEIDDYFRGQFT